MICLCIGKPDAARCKDILRDVPLAEIRLDGASLSVDEVRQIFSLPAKLIATCRPNPGLRSEKERKNLLLAAIDSGADYIDIEIEAGPDFKNQLIQAARFTGCRVIISYHNYQNTPPTSELEAVINRCFLEGAGIAKIACQVHSPRDSARVLSLYDLDIKKNKEIIAIGMGEEGKITRIAAPLLGAPFTYASLSTGNETGPGQIDKDSLEKILQQITGYR